MRRPSNTIGTVGPLLLLLALAASGAHAAPAFAPRFATDVRVTGLPLGGARVLVRFTSAPGYSARVEQHGTRLIVDVPDAEVRGAPPAITYRSGVLGGVLTQSYKSGTSRVTRVLVTLLEPARHAIRAEGNDLVIELTRGSVEPSAAPLPLESPSEAKVARPAVPAVGDVRFEHGTLDDKVVIELSALPEYQESELDATRSRLILRGTRLPEALSKTLDVSAFKGRVSAISSFVPKGKGDQVVIEVERSLAAQSRIVRRGQTLIWSFFDPGRLPSTVTGVGRDGGVARRIRTVHVDESVKDVPEVHAGFDEPEPAEVTAGAQAVATSSDEAAGAFLPHALGQRARNFSGQRIDVDFQNMDIHNVLRFFADIGRVNIVTSDEVKGHVTITMKNVPWDQALDVVLQAKGLGMVRQANMIRVAPLADLEKEREMQIARRQQEVKLAPLETRLIPVSYALATDIQQRAQPLLSERGSIAVDDRTNMMIVRDISGNLNQIEELTRSLDTQTAQVLIEARIVEATSRYLRDAGIQWGGDASFSAANGNPTGLRFPSSVGVVGGASDANTPTSGLSPFQNLVPNPNFAVNLPATVGTGQGGAIGLTFGALDNSINLAVRLSAAESEGMLRILSSPRVLTLDNRQAKISQGTLIPYSQVSALGVQTSFQEAKLQLLVTPHVTADGSISMHVKINRDEPDFNQTSVRGDPTILKREAETDLLVMDGHTAVIGGIFTRNTGKNIDQVPFFGDIPVLGLLFQRRKATDSRGELVIFLTPRIVNRAEALGR